MYLIYIALLIAYIVQAYLYLRLRRIDQAIRYHVGISTKELIAERNRAIASALRGDLVEVDKDNEKQEELPIK